MLKSKIFIFVAFACLLLPGLPARAQPISFNEIMFDPEGADYFDEFIELVNNSDAPFNLDGANLIINGSPETLVFPESNTILAPGDRALILDRGYLIDKESFSYQALIPTGTLLFTIQDNSFGKNGLLNTEPNELLLISAAGDTLSRVVTTPDQSSGFSDEKVLSDGPNTPDNWSNSQVKPGTPGLRNSVSPKDFDLAISSFRIATTAREIEPGRPVGINVSVTNVGLQPCSDADIVFGIDVNTDSVLQISEYLFGTTETLVPGDSARFELSIPDPVSGSTRLIAAIDFYRDEQKNDNIRFLELRVPYPRQAVAINEFMYYPIGETGLEWAELVNISDDTLNLKHWTIADASIEALLTGKDFFLPPQEYVVIARDSSFLNLWETQGRFLDCEQNFPILNNSKDSIIIQDLTGRVMDRVGYSSQWGYSQGITLERRNPYFEPNDARNWGLSLAEAGGTPGFVNSLRFPEHDLQLQCENVQWLSENLLPGKTVILQISVANVGLRPAAGFSFDILYYQSLDSISASRLIFQKAWADTLQPFASLTDTLRWEIDQGGMGFIYCSIHYSLDLNLQNDDITLPLTVGYPVHSAVLNEIMYNPASGKPEWFEILNISRGNLNLQNWAFKDANATHFQLTEFRNDLKPDSFAVITGDENFRSAYPNFHGKLIITPAFPALNNTVDSLVILDAVQHRLDSLAYDSRWGDRKGFSLERRNPCGASTDEANWGLSQSESGSTPGYRNTIATRNLDLALDSIFLSVTPPPVDGRPAEIHARIYNAGLNPVPTFDLAYRIETMMNDSIAQTVLDTTLQIDIALAAGTTRTEILALPSLPGGVQRLIGRILLDGDGEPSNNSDSIWIRIGYAPQAVVINEILYAPESGESEWFELYNRSQRAANLNSWEFHDASGKWLALIDSTFILDAGDFCVVAANADFLQGYPGFAGLLIVPDNFPTLNNRSDSLFIRDARANRLDRVYYQQEWGGGSGISIERRDPNSAAIAANNWRSSQSGNGATPGAANSVLKFEYDLTILPDSFHFDDSLTAPGQQAPFSVTMKNSGMLASPTFSVAIYHDRNNDASGTPDEEVWVQSNIPMPAPDEQLTIHGELYAGSPGLAHFIVVIETEGDENPADNSATTRLYIAFAPGTLSCNEFLPYPILGQTEFIEWFNCSDASLDLYLWQLSNRHSRVTIREHSAIPAGEYVVFTGDSSFFTNYALPGVTVIVPEKWPGLNNSAGEIGLRDLTGSRIDSLSYGETWEVVPGFSFEKIHPQLASADAASWKICEDSRGATPGRINSVSPYLYDLAQDSVTVSRAYGDTASTFPLTIYLRNAGQAQCDSAKLILLERSAAALTPIAQLPVPPLAPVESWELQFTAGPFGPGLHFLVSVIQWSRDGNPKNDSLVTKIKIAYREETIRISEFMAFPPDVYKTGTSIAEYIELRNSGESPINPGGWYFSDENTARRVEIYHPYALPPDSFLVIASDSSIFAFQNLRYYNTCITADFPSLNNDADQIIIQDLTGKTIDSLQYDSDWNIQQGVSMERIYLKNPNTKSNWRASVSPRGGTPGLVNSVVIKQALKKFGIQAKPNPFSPNGDGIDDEVGIHFQLPFASAKVTVDIYDLAGRLVFNPAITMRTSSEGVIYWNGDSEQGEKARVGMYVARLNATDLATNKTVGYITTIVRAR